MKLEINPVNYQLATSKQCGIAPSEIITSGLWLLDFSFADSGVTPI